MKRYPSIDFMRGLAIFVMVYLHTFLRWFDQDAFEARVLDGSASVFMVILLVVSLFLGGWAGFFLMVSSVGNMVSMYKGLDKGLSWKKLIMRQVMVGVLLLVFAYLSEAIIGYKGGLGDLVLGKANWQNDIYHRGYHMETIHAVAWCIIINGIIQGLLSKNDGFKKVKRNIKIYALLAVIVVVMTPLVWAGLDRFIANGNFSSGIDPITGHGWQYGDLLDGSLWKNISRVFLSALGGNVEPIFPFLAVSFIGSIIGLYIMKQSSIQGEKSTRPLKKGMMAAFVMVCIGLVGCLAVLLISGGDTVDNALTLLQNSDSMPQLHDNLGIAWLFMFILLTGSQIGCMLLIFRLVEFRGKGEAFAKKTLFFRRFGFVAFSVYNFQFVDVIPVLIVGLLIPGVPGTIQGVYKSLNVVTIWLAILLIMAFWMLLLKIWEKVHYVFSLEWFIAKISMVLIPIKKREIETQVQWWKTPRLDPVAALHEVEWLDINTKEGIDHGNLKESKLSRQLAYCGWLFFPAFFISFGISRSSAKKEDTNKINKQAKIISIIGIAWVLSFAVVTSLLPIGLIL